MRNGCKWQEKRIRRICKEVSEKRGEFTLSQVLDGMIDDIKWAPMQSEVAAFFKGVPWVRKTGVKTADGRTKMFYVYVKQPDEDFVEHINNTKVGGM